MPCLELEAVLLEIRTVVLELRRLEGDGLDGLVVASRRQQLDGCARAWPSSSAATGAWPPAKKRERRRCRRLSQ